MSSPLENAFKKSSGKSSRWFTIGLLGIGVPTLIFAAWPILMFFCWLAIPAAGQYLGIGVEYHRQLYTFDNQINTAFKQVDKVLFENKLCKDLATCTVNGPVYLQRERNGFGIHIFNIYDKKILGEIAQPFIDTFNNTPNISRLDIVAYGFPVGQGTGYFLWLKTPIYNVELRRTK